QEDVMATTMQKLVIDRPEDAPWQVVPICLEKISEWFWFLLSFSLFVVLGPFSAPVVLVVLCRLGLQERDLAEPESASPQ
ncbi:MAG: hypothetical protein ACWGOX_15005, partial [Desulforhopalus sp.]